MRLIFVRPELTVRGVSLYYPLGLVAVATITKDLGHSVKILDLNLEKSSVLRENLNKADVVCFSAMITNFNIVMEWNKRIRNEYVDLLQIIGGPITLALKESLVSEGSFDYISMGSGELTMPAILDLITGKIPANVVVEKERDTLTVIAGKSFSKVYEDSPFPDISLLQYKRYTNNEYLFRLKPHGYCANLETSRGCPYSCTFCDKSVWGNKWAGKPAKVLAEHIFYLHNEFNINKFHLVDDLFIFDKKRVIEFCDLISPLKKTIAWYCNVRANLVNEEIFASLSKAGCRVVSMGIESGSQKILDTIKKRTTRAMVEEAVSQARRFGLELHGNFVIGLPGENRESMEETCQLLQKLQLKSITFSIATPFPNTELYDWAQSKGLIPADYDFNIGDWNRHVNVNLTDNLSDEEITSYFQKLEVEFIFKKLYGPFFFFHPEFIIKSIRKVLLLLRNKQHKRLLFTVVGFVKTCNPWKKYL